MTKSDLQLKVAKALRPTAVEISNEVLLWQPFETSPVVYYVRFFGDRACKINVQRSHDPAAAISLLHVITAAQLDVVSSERPLHMFETLALTGMPFDRQVIVHPVLDGGGLSNETAFMGPMTYTTFPAYRCEFTSDDSLDEAAFRLRKVVRWSNWQRQPAPALRARFLRVRTGIRSTPANHMGGVRIEELEHLMDYLAEDDGFVDIENFERSLAHVQHVAGRFEVHQGPSTWTMTQDQAKTWLKIFATDGAENADKKEERK